MSDLYVNPDAIRKPSGIGVTVRGFQGNPECVAGQQEQVYFEIGDDDVLRVYVWVGADPIIYEFQREE